MRIGSLCSGYGGLAWVAGPDPGALALRMLLERASVSVAA